MQPKAPGKLHIATTSRHKKTHSRWPWRRGFCPTQSYPNASQGEGPVAVLRHADSFLYVSSPMPRLFTYTISIDDGAAPNPFRGMCSLAICKPGIRRVAKEGDWVAGLGAKNAPSGDLSGRLVYAMRVEEVFSMKQYDQLAPSRWPHRVPNIRSADLADRLGDCIYDYSTSAPTQRASVHGTNNVATDLSGENVLISTDFYYFGSRAISLPEFLLPICHQTQGHRSKF